MKLGSMLQYLVDAEDMGRIGAHPYDRSDECGPSA